MYDYTKLHKMDFKIICNVHQGMSREIAGFDVECRPMLERDRSDRDMWKRKL